jgi:hypothetical protein
MSDPPPIAPAALPPAQNLVVVVAAPPPAGRHPHNSQETPTPGIRLPQQEGVTIHAAEGTGTLEITSKTNDDTTDHHVLYENVTMKDVDVDGNENPVGINGIRWEQMHVRHLRIICSKLSVRGVKNAKKAHIIETLTRWCRDKLNYDAMMASYDDHTTTTTTGAAPKRKEVQCTFRLMNILFSDEFAFDFATIGNVASKQSLDSGKAGNNQEFWERVKDAFVEPNNDVYDRLYFTDDDVFAVQSHINPSRIVDHRLRGKIYSM